MKEGKQQTTSDWTRIYYDAWNRRDWEWIGAMLSSDVEWQNSARDEKIKGVNGVIAAFRNVVENYPNAFIELKTVHAAGNIIVAECAIKASREATALRTPAFCEIMEIEKGRCVRGTTYADSVRLLMDMNEGAAAA